MSLSDNDITNVERGIDAAINAILGMAQQSLVKMNAANDPGAAPFMGFVQALVEHRQALANKSLMDALVAHPDIGEAEVSLEPEKEGTVQ